MRPVSRQSEDAAMQQYSVSRRPPHQTARIGRGGAAVALGAAYTRNDERSRGAGAPLSRSMERLFDGALVRSESRRAASPLARARPRRRGGSVRGGGGP